MSDSPTETFEHTDHATHAAHSGEPYLAKVTITVALLAVIAATVGSLETMESGQAISQKNESVLHQNKASDTWAFYQARSIKKNLYEVAAAVHPEKAGDFERKATQYDTENAEIRRKAEAFEAHTEAALRAADVHEHRHHILTVGATLLHVSIAVATIGLVLQRRRWPWHMAILLGVAGSATAATAYVL